MTCNHLILSMQEKIHLVKKLSGKRHWGWVQKSSHF
jgi:hypothetical protein